MDSTFKKNIFLVLAILLLIIAGILETGYLRKHPEVSLIEEFQQELNRKEIKLNDYIDEISTIVSADSFKGDYLGQLHQYGPYMEEGGYGFLVFEGSELKYWSDRTISFYDYLPETESNEKLVVLPNGYYLQEKAESGAYSIIGLILIKYNYPHVNEYLRNSFRNSFNLPDSYGITEEKGQNSFPVYSKSGSYLFSVQPVGEVLCTKGQLFYPGVLYLLALFLLMVYGRYLFKYSNRPVVFRLFVLAAALFCVYWMHVLFNFPKVFYILDFFSPGHFGYSIWLPSLGDYAIVTLFFFYWALNLSLDLDFEKLIKESLMPPRLVVVIIFLALGGLFLLINNFIGILVENSSISFSLNHIIELSSQSVIAYFSIAFQMLGLAVITVKVVEDTRKVVPRKTLIASVITVTFLLAILQLLVLVQVSLPVLILFLAFLIILVFFTIEYLYRYSLSYLIILISVFSVFTLFVVYNTVSQKEREAQRLFAQNLVTEYDPAAEMFLTEIQNQVNIDSVIPTYLLPPFENLDELEIYIVNRYFGGYFRDYDIQITVCRGNDDLLIQPDNITVPCFPFFDEWIDSQGLQIQGTSFYFMDNMNGRITYFGKLHYPLSYNTLDTLGIAVFVELNSSIVSEGIGYPELLIDKSMKRPDSYKRFHYAQYFDGQLVGQSGDFDYSQNISTYNPGIEEFTYREWDNHEHVIYHSREENYVIVSREVYGLIEYLISFPYIFVFYFLVTIIFLLLGNRSLRKKSISFDLKFRIQASIISIVLLSLLIVAGGTIIYNIDTYKNKHRESLDEKMKSVAEEFEMRKDRVANLTPENIDWMFNELVKLSNVFRTDVNVYDVNGELIATSRPEIFEKGLISDKMNLTAYYELYNRYQTKYIQTERIGDLSYLSAYQPIINDDGRYLGFINLPYFIRQDKYSQEISTLIVAFINLYVILLLASIIVAVFISNQITRPLTMIRENLRKMELGKRSEPIGYTRNDEIGSLVKEYNKKVDELAASAELLARSERESAWREMAKQIAHEIKNPLTPMKLNIQYLQRLTDASGDADGNIGRITKLLIEQIDTLSAIAAEFSNFAQIPLARNQVFNLSGQLKNTIELFDTHDKADIHLKFEESEDIFVNADREQFSRAVINLIKNAIQAIPDNQEGLVRISLKRSGHKAVISIEDNGSGIAPELQDKLFSPSFTTKTSGMGLGLAITKNIVENFKGRIWFHTKPGKGTTFFIEIPIYEKTEYDENNSTE